MSLNRFARLPLAHLPTPLEPLTALSRHLGGPRLFIKRDDCTGLALGGNKTRKLEFLLADARAQGADTLVTIGATQSNHVRQTAAAAAKYGFSCEVVLQAAVGGRDPNYAETGNVQLDYLLGARVHHAAGNTNRDTLLADIGAAVKQRGGKPYIIPVGGSNGIGGLGYAAFAEELVAQERALDMSIDTLVLATGSGGTQGGIVAGMQALGRSIRTLGVAISSDEATTRAKVEAVARDTATLLGLTSHAPIEVVGGHVGSGYGQPTDAMIEAVSWLAANEGLILDPVYTGKAMAGLFALVRAGTFRPDETVVFLHTGGAPALFGYRSTFSTAA